MKAIIPIVNELPIEFGITLTNFKRLNDSSIKILFPLWNGCNYIRSVEVCQKKFITIFLSDIFSEGDIKASSVATAVFIDFTKPKKEYKLFEIQLMVRSNDHKNFASILYDMVPDHDKNYLYSPILHCAHTAIIDENIDTYILMANHRRLPENLDKQKIRLSIIKGVGTILSKSEEIVNFNSSKLISFRDKFSEFNFEAGDQIDIKGGNSQFAIFTIFFNKNSKSIGIEHSLPPIYYVSDIYKNPNRKLFFSNLGFNLK
jgi:hypothetical protein